MASYPKPDWLQQFDYSSAIQFNPADFPSKDSAAKTTITTSSGNSMALPTANNAICYYKTADGKLYTKSNLTYDEVTNILRFAVVNLGINKTTPVKTLHVGGTFQADSAGYFGGNLTVTNVAELLSTIISLAQKTTIGPLPAGGTAPNTWLCIDSGNEGPKITLWDGNDPLNHFGFSISASQLDYFTGGSHVFYQGGKTKGDLLSSELLRINSTGLGIKQSAFNTLLSIDSYNSSPKITLYDYGDPLNHFGFGTSYQQLDYHVTSDSSHVFYHGGKTPGDGLSQETVRITGTGIGIKQNTGYIYSPLSISSLDTGPKITLWDDLSYDYHSGFGISPAQFNFQIPSSTNSFVFYQGFKNNPETTATEVFRIKGTGNICVNGASGNANLHINGTTQNSGTFNALVTSGAIASVAKTSNYPKQLIATHNTVGNNIGMCFSNNSISSSTSVPGADIMYGRTDATNDIGKLDFNLTTSATTRENIMSIQPTQIQTIKPIYTNPAVYENKMVLYGNSTNCYGFGVTANNLNYVTTATTANHSWYAGGSNAGGTLLMRLWGTGLLGIGIATPLQRLSISSNTTESKISLYDGGNAAHIYGFGVSSGQLNYHTQALGTHAWYSGGKNGDGTLTMKLTSTGDLTLTAGLTCTGVTSTGNISTTSGSVSGASISSSGSVSAGSVTSSGSVSAGSVTSTGSVSAGSVSSTGTVSAGSVTTSGAVSAGSLTSSGNILVSSAGVEKVKLDTTGNITCTGAVTSNGNIIVSSGGVDKVKLDTTGNINCTGAATVGTLNSGAISVSSIDTTGNVTIYNSSLAVKIGGTTYVNLGSTGVISCTNVVASAGLIASSGDIKATTGTVIINPNAHGSKVSLWTTATSDVGFGTSSGQVNYYVEAASSASSHVFLAAGYNSTATGTVLMKIRGDGNIGIGGITTPTYKLHCGTDSCAKPTTSGWTVASDERIKENIEIADISICYENIKKLPLKRYRWKEDVYTDEQINDRNCLGWIAQEVEQVFPKAVTKKNMFGYEDCRDLQNDEIYKALYGCVQKMIEKIETLEAKVSSLESQLNISKN